MSSQPALQPDSLVQRVARATFEPFDDEYLAIDAESGFCYSLNETAARVWEAIEAPAALGALCDAVCAQYAVDAETCRADVLELVQQLQDFGLVRVSPPQT